VVAAGLARRLEVQIAYAIGVARPVSIFVESFGTSKLTNSELVELIAGHFDLRPAAIIERLDLPWERTDKAVELHQAVFRKSA